MRNDKLKPKKEEQQITRIARIKAKKFSFFYKQKMTIINSFVRFVLFVVKKWEVGGKTIKISVVSVVKYLGGELCGLCGLISPEKR